MTKRKCDGDCFNCKRPQDKCKGMPRNRHTPFEKGGVHSGPNRSAEQNGSGVKDTGRLFGGKTFMARVRGRWR